MFVLLHCFHWYAAKEYIIPNDARLTRRCLSVIDKSWEHRYLNVKPGCFAPIRITVWSGFAGWNHMKTNLRAWVAHKLQQHISPSLSSCLCWDATDHTLIPLCCLCKSHVAGLISIILLGSGWTWSSLVVYINSDSQDYRVYAATLRGSEGDTVTKPSEQTGLNQTYCIFVLLVLAHTDISISSRRCLLLGWTQSKPRNYLKQSEMSTLNKFHCSVCWIVFGNPHHVVSLDNPAPGFKGWNEETRQQIIFDKFCFPSGGKRNRPF